MKHLKNKITGFWILSILATTACGDPLKYGQDLENSRTLGATLQSESGSTPAAGEEGSFSLLFAGEGGPIEAQVSYQICAAADSARGVPYCASAPWAEGTTERSASPMIDWQVPDSVEDGTRIALLGVACESGAPELAEDPLDWSCDDGSTPLNFSFDAWVLSGDFENENPDLGEASVSLGDEELVFEETSVDASCDGVPTFAREETHILDLTLGEGARESYEDEFLGIEDTETLQVSLFATEGRLERQFSIIDSSEDAATTLEWEAPEEPGAVKFYAVVRDGRGGVNWLSFSACVE